MIGSVLSTVFYGVTFVQMIMYYETGKKDLLWMRLLVLYLFATETVKTIFDILLVYEPLVSNIGKIITTIPTFLRTDAGMTAAISTPVQIFMAWRICVIVTSYVPMILITPLALLSFGAGIWTSAGISRTLEFSQLADGRIAPITWLVSSAMTDVIITAYLAYVLSKKKSGIDHMDNYLSRIIRLTIQTGGFTAAAALADAIVFLTVKDTTIFFIWDLSLSKLYINSLLSSMNARNTWKHERNLLFEGSSSGNGTVSATSGVNQRVFQLSQAPYPPIQSIELTQRNYPPRSTSKMVLDLGKEV